MILSFAAFAALSFANRIYAFNDTNPISPSGTILQPVSRHHPARLGSKTNVPSLDVVLHYAEETYQVGAHYASTIQWIMKEPTIVLNDDPSISSFTCGVVGDTITWTDDQSYAQALDTWSTPMFIIAEDGSSGCEQFNDGDPTYNVYHIESVISNNNATRSITFDAVPQTFGQAATHHKIFVGRQQKAVPVAGGHIQSRTLVKRAEKENVNFNLNYDWLTGKSLEPLTLADIKNDNSKKNEGIDKALVVCRNCWARVNFEIEFATSNLLVKALINVVINVAKLFSSFGKFVKEFVKEIFGGASANAMKVSGHVTYNEMRGEVEKAINGFLKNTVSDEKRNKKLPPRILTPLNYLNVLIRLRDIREFAYHRLGKSFDHIMSGKDRDTRRKVEAMDRQYRNAMAKLYTETVDDVKRAAFKAGVTEDQLVVPPHTGFWNRDMERTNGEGRQLYRMPVRSSLSGSELSIGALQSLQHLERRAQSIVRRSTTYPKDYLAIKGNLYANMELAVDVKGTVRKDVYSKTLRSQLLKGIKIPGVITIGPELDLEGIVSVLAEGEADFSYGGSLAWTDVEVVYDLASMSKSESSTVSPAVFKELPQKETKVNKGKLGLGIGVSLEPRLIFSVDLTLAGKAAAVRGGVGVRFGVDLVATVGSLGGIPGDAATPTDTCPHGVELKFRLQKTIPALLYGKGEKKNLKHEAIGAIPGKNLYSHCFDLSSAVCGAGEVFYAWSAPPCVKKVTIQPVIATTTTSPTLPAAQAATTITTPTATATTTASPMP
ncbi:hypothetical protein T439DRAFT_320428 [Meredithblackwellia eburnea MCA 4105]